MATIFLECTDFLSRFELLEPCEPRRGIPYPQHVTWRQRAGVFVTCQNSDLVKREEPARPPSPHPLHHSTCHWHFTKRMMLQCDTVYLLHHASSRSDRPSSTAAGRAASSYRLGMKLTRGSPFTTLVSESGLLLVPVVTTSLLARNSHHAGLLSMRRSTRCKPCLTI
jgi:hypothetical protein